jgi:hypothetical protein
MKSQRSRTLFLAEEILQFDVCARVGVRVVGAVPSNRCSSLMFRLELRTLVIYQ